MGRKVKYIQYGKGLRLMAKMYLMCGLSGVGKTTYAKQFAADNNLLYLGVDDFYAKVNGDECIHENQFEVWIEFYKAIHEAEVNGIDCIVDTNAITKCHRDQFLEWFPTFEHHLILIRCEEKLRYMNNSSRRRVVPDDVMLKMFINFEYPQQDEVYKWDSVKVVYNTDNVFSHSIMKKE